jgi:hypothetical protein
MFQSFFSSLFGCSHQRTTFPLTPGRKSSGYTAASAVRSGTYVVCLDCGKEFAYDWDGMRIGRQVPAHVAEAPVAAAQPIYR